MNTRQAQTKDVRRSEAEPPLRPESAPGHPAPPGPRRRPPAAVPLGYRAPARAGSEDKQQSLTLRSPAHAHADLRQG